MSKMERYTVKFIAGERRGSLLIALSPTQLCSALVDAVKTRVPISTIEQECLDVKDLHATLHLEEPDGPMLYAADRLSDVLPGAKETVVVVFQVPDAFNLSRSEHSASPQRGPSFKVRIVSPEQSRSTEISALPTLPDEFPLTSTLGELKSRVQKHLGFPPDDGECLELECNCKFARQIYDKAVLSSHGHGEHKKSDTVIVVHGNNEVAALPVKEATSMAMQNAISEFFPKPNKVLNTIGGIEFVTGTGRRIYANLPVLAICSRHKHSAGRGSMADGDRDLVVDLHTSECPIEVTSHNSGVTLATAGLQDCTVDGVLNIYAVQRWTTANSASSRQGKAAIFKSAEAWEHPHGQSDRGISNLLSTLRVFAHLTAGGTMDRVRQDAVLHMIHLLTRFPPAVRAAYILMRGETPRMSERAALAQCLYEVLKSVVPLRVIKSDPKRYYEGSRLLFGLILEKAKNLKVSSINDDVDLPYIDMPVFDLRNPITMEPVLSVPVHTIAGLLDDGFYKAFQADGLLTWTNGTDTTRITRTDAVLHRISILSGGTKYRVLGFSLDAIQSSSRYVDRGDISQVISLAEYTELSYLATLCSRNSLSVVPPSALPSATPPVLTLDRDGSLSVYIGRAGCGGEPGRDILIFRPTSAADEEGVDVSVITQLLEPKLSQRTANGTIFFEAYGDQHRKLMAPDEITMLCVDLSTSMSQRCDFIDIQGNEDLDTQMSCNAEVHHAASIKPTTEDPSFPRPDSDELKEYLKAHESYDDFLAIIRTGKDDYQRRRNAEKVLQILQQLDDQEIEAKSKILASLQRQASLYVVRTRADKIARELGILKNRYLGLQKYKSLLLAWFLNSVHDYETASSDPLAWRPGDTIPTAPLALELPASAESTFEIPREFCCHISSGVMEDPVITVDNYIYERKNIERWFQTNETSPLTNLILNSLDLVPDTKKKQEILEYTQGVDIISRYQSLHNDSTLLRVSIKSPIDNWSILLPRNLKLSELWELSFRLSKGRYIRFELQHRNARLPQTEATITSTIDVNHAVFIAPLEVSKTAGGNVREQMCLVKVYGKYYHTTAASYWEPKNTTRSLGSAVFRYYRAKFSAKSTTDVEEPFVFWSLLYDKGDKKVAGTTLAGPWEPLSQYLQPFYCTGTLDEESAVDKNPDEDSDNHTNDRRLPAFPSGGRAERTLVFKVMLDSAPASKASPVRYLSRLDVLKQMFDAFINRILAYGFQNHIGLVTFGTKATVSQKITNAVENFRHKLNNMNARGDTALWDSIALAEDQVENYAAKYPNAKVRIICISDGEDNKSKQSMVHVTSRLQRRGITVDSFCLGDAHNEDLQTLSHLTGGYTFEPKTLEEAMAICELEPVLSSLERPDLAPSSESNSQKKFRTSPTGYNFALAYGDVEVQRVSRDHFPKRKEHPQLVDTFVQLGRFARISTQARSDGGLRLSRIHTEIRISGAQHHPDYDIYICESNMALWKVVMQGPPESTYTGGTFLLYIEMGAEYPMLAPTARFITPIYHPNINRHGRICHSILDRNWTVDTSNSDLLNNIYSLLLVPEFSDPINTVVTLNYHGNEVQFKEEAQEHVQKHAGKTRAEFQEEIVGGM